MVRGRGAELRKVFLGSGSGGAPFRVRYLGGDPTYGKDTGGVTPTGGATYHEANLPVTIWRELALTSVGILDDNGRSGGTGELH